MRYFIVFILLFFATSVLSDVELMVKGKEYWKKNHDISEWTKEDFKDFWRQKHKGEIISVLKGGSEFGKLDVPPHIIHIRVTGVTYEEALNYLHPLSENSDTTIVKERRFHFMRVVIDSAITLWNADSTFLIITKAQASNLIKEYDMDNVKQKIIDRLKE